MDQRTIGITHEFYADSLPDYQRTALVLWLSKKNSIYFLNSLISLQMMFTKKRKNGMEYRMKNWEQVSHLNYLMSHDYLLMFIFTHPLGKMRNNRKGDNPNQPYIPPSYF